MPLLLGFILGPMMQENLRRAMLITNGDPSIFVTRPVSAAFLLLALALVGRAFLPKLGRKREVVFQEQ